MNVSRLRSEAKKLLKAGKAGEQEALARLRRVVRVDTDRPLKLGHVQHALAVEAGYRSWADLVNDPKNAPRGGG